MNKTDSKPRVIFFDAVGTLFGIRGSIGEIYSQIAHRHGVEVEAKLLNQSFGEIFSKAEPLLVQTAEPDLIKKQEYQWWYQLVESTFLKLESLDKFTDFESFFAEL